ncbi:phospholipase D active site motif containing protein [Pseudozyma hubeiensis SY62]|uniref:Phospholipase n=1 Tax=Pseudozyma hubeiensis (strain SY62) TaxID=1305764 RepID=R9P2M6_PSEHS|nr:phospholipase D active site motif containing protein [Pseudozyma hubeiensis SY62]GAC95524.1 phospholipase D active site motif containing protein [Pseudozyma hubeiensis SY62]
MSSGTSFADLAHQAWDTAASATGLSSVGEYLYPGEASEDAPTSGGNPTSQKDQDANPSDDATKHSEHPEKPYHGAPGNHPDDPRARINHPDAVNGHADASGGQSANEPKVDNHDNSVKEQSAHHSASTKHPHLAHREDDMGQSIIERALGDEGLTAQRQGTIYDKQLENEMDGSYKDVQKQTKPEVSAAELGEPVHSERNRSTESHDKGPTAEQNEDAHQPHAANRGPSWASRPDDKQRAKIAKMKEEQANGTWKRRFSSFGPSASDGTSTPSGKNNEDKEKDKGGSLFGSRFDSDSPARPGLNIFSSSSANRTKDQNGEASANEKQRPQSGSRPEASRTSSRWAENSNKMRNAFEPPTPSAEAASDDANAQQADQDDLPTPELSPDDQKLRAITKIMLGSGKQKQEPTSPEATSASGLGGEPQAQTRWAQLKKKVRDSQKAKREQQKASAVGLDLAKELQTGILPVFLLKMAVERDEAKRRRIPVLLNHLRLRVTDSVNPMHNTHAVFRIELEYGDGLVKWVIYRELRDFINLHTHYRAAALRGYLGRSIGGNSTEGDVGLPSFPKMSLPYFNQLQRQGKTSRADFARAQRDALENYIIELIRRTMFRAEANRLCKFFEISALSVSLASRGGHQGKQGYLRILSRSSRKKDQKSMLTPARWAKAYEPKWFIVRESFIAIVDEPDSLQLYDVFLMDNEFKVERPKRLYKQTMHIAHGFTHSDEKKGAGFESSEQPDASKGAEGKDASYDKTALLTGGHFKDADPTKREEAHSDERHTSSHTFYIHNSERKLKLVAKNERMMEQFITSMQKMATGNIFGGTNRFESFAPIRLNVSAQWLADGRDYYWNLSKALMMAKDRVFIHDWWLSPELYLRRPGHPKWRLDNVLKKKAEEGVKIFVIIYNEVSNNFTPTDSNYTKQRLIGLHRNIFVQRSPSHFQTGTFYWAHHEKLCVIDETIAFMGGLDLCFGRYDTPAHVLVDDALFHKRDGESEADHGLSSRPGFLGPAKDGREAHIWPGQDYANERVMEWHTLSKPAEDLFARDKFPRMPWHDVGLQLVGQPARDLCRHFIQRWNFLLRIKNHTRQMPFLVPPPDFTPEELQKYGLTGTCEVQICRSAGPWSLGTANKVEHSIQNAYLKSIQMSDHFVYIENQFFVTSTVMEGNKIENKIGEALVSRIIRAHREGTPWRAIIVIPLIPGFPMPIDHPDASSVRLIVDLQNRSISRGEHSIFGKLRREGIDPEQYISFFSLRTWGKLRGGQLTTEQIYLHDKIMVVDDRLVIIGSANINERSQRGDRDSELASVIRDHDMIDSSMGGQPYKVGRFAHTLRMRLMREHLGVDVDELEANERKGAANGDEDSASEESSDEEDAELAGSDDEWDPDREQSHGGLKRHGDTETSPSDLVEVQATKDVVRDKASNLAELGSGTTSTMRRQIKDTLKGSKEKMEVEAEGARADPASSESANHNERYQKARVERVDQALRGQETDKFVDGQYDNSMEPTLEEKLLVQDGHAVNGKSRHSAENDAKKATAHGQQRAPADHRQLLGSLSSSSLGPERESDMLRRSGQRGRFLSDGGPEDVRRKIASRMSNDLFNLPAGTLEIDPMRFQDPVDDSFYVDYWLTCAVHNTQIFRKVFKCVPDDTVTTWAEYKAFGAWSDRLARSGKFGAKESRSERDAQAHSAPGASVGGPAGQVSTRTSTSDAKHDDSSSQVPSTLRDAPSPGQGSAQNGSTALNGGTAPKDHKKEVEGFSERELDQMESLLEECRGSLVLHPTRFLEAEDHSNNFLFAMDRINPLLIYD